MRNNKKTGRPTKFQPRYTEELVKFFDIEPYTKMVSEKSTESFKDGGIKKESVKYRLIPNKMPTLYRFSKKIGVDYVTVWRWAEGGDLKVMDDKIDKAILSGRATSGDIEHLTNLKAFCNAYKEAKELQKDFLINIGLAGAAPAPFAIFTAKNVTDMRDSAVVTHTMPRPLLEALRTPKEKDALLNNDSDKETSGAE